MTLEKSIIGCILGTAVGDAFGLPYEGLNPLRARKLLGQPDRHRLLFGYGLVSDDTEHIIYVVRSLVTSKFNPDRFERQLARSLRWWLAGLPAGAGFATLRAVFKLWLGIPPGRSGVFSAGNGPAMRSAILGIAFGENPAVLSDWVLRSTRITHSDPKAFFGAFTVALAAHLSSVSRNVLPQDFVHIVSKSLAKYESTEFVELMKVCHLSPRQPKCWRLRRVSRISIWNFRIHVPYRSLRHSNMAEIPARLCGWITGDFLCWRRYRYYRCDPRSNTRGTSWKRWHSRRVDNSHPGVASDDNLDGAARSLPGLVTQRRRDSEVSRLLWARSCVAKSDLSHGGVVSRFETPRAALLSQVDLKQ